MIINSENDGNENEKSGEQSAPFESVKERALHYLSLYKMGFNLVPADGKATAVSWKNWQLVRMPLKAFQYFCLLVFKKNWNFALLTGAMPWSKDIPGIIVVDTDDEEAERIVRERCPMTPVMQKTGRGGLHRLYLSPGYSIGNRVRMRIDGMEYGIDIRGDRGYIIAPGSIHPDTGKEYVALQTWTLELLKQCPVYDPAWLESGQTASRASQAVIQPDTPAPESIPATAQKLEVEMPVDAAEDESVSEEQEERILNEVNRLLDEIRQETTKEYLQFDLSSLEHYEHRPVSDSAWLESDGSADSVGELSQVSAPSMTSAPRMSATVQLPAPKQDLAGRTDPVVTKITISVEERERQAHRYLQSVPGTTAGEGADNRCASLVMTLLEGFALPADSASKLLEEWGRRSDQKDRDGSWYPWTEEELQRKIDWAIPRIDASRFGERLSFKDQPVSPSNSNAIRINPRDARGTAKLFLESTYLIAESQSEIGADCSGSSVTYSLVRFNLQWFTWRGTHYEHLQEEPLRNQLWSWLSKCEVNAKDGVVPYLPNSSFITAILDSMKSLVTSLYEQSQPCWLSADPNLPDPDQIIAYKNGLFDVDDYLKTGNIALLEHNPNWFSTNFLPHNFNPAAECPLWTAFLTDVLDGDQERIRILQMWFGYNLVADNRYQKLVMLVGARRGGKGTTLAIFKELLGMHNVHCCSLSDLNSQFGLAALPGKTACVIDEAQIGRSTDLSKMLEKLKSITGGSEQTIDRKFLSALTNVRLKVRFTFALNELPKLPDNSGAMQSRVVLIPYFNSYLGKENVNLLDELKSEITGINNWAIEGLKLLRRTNRLDNPAASRELLQEFEDSSSAISIFLRDCCEVSDAVSIPRDALYKKWCEWCVENGHHAGSNSDFGRKLRAALPSVRDGRRQMMVEDDTAGRIVERRVRCYVGVTIRLST